MNNRSRRDRGAALTTDSHQKGAREPNRHALSNRLPLSTRLSTYVRLNLQSLFSSLGRLYRTPFSSMMTILVLGIALALPSGLYVLLLNLQSMSGGWNGAAKISLFMKQDVTDAQAQALAKKLNLLTEIDQIQTLTRAQSLEEFKQLSGFGQALDALQENPLPAVLIVQPQSQTTDPKLVDRLVQKLSALPETDLAQLDLQWVKRLYAIMEIGQRGVLIIAGLLALAVLLTVGNTIRLDIQNRKEEIIITKLIGATNAFIRRPFLYTGMWYGLFGALIAWVLIVTSLNLLQGPARQLAILYSSNFSLLSLSLEMTLILLGIGVVLGLLGSALAVGKHLKAIEPG